MDRGYPPSKWDEPDGTSSQRQAVGNAVNRSLPGSGEETRYNTSSDQARRDKLSQAYGRKLLSGLQTSLLQSSSSINPTSGQIPLSPDNVRSNPFPSAFVQKHDKSETEAPKPQVLAHSKVPQMPVNVGSHSPISTAANLNADALRQQIMLAGIHALAGNNPSLQAQLLLGQNLPLLGGNARKIVPDGSGLLKYRAPDIDSFVFDQNAGYKFDSTTGLHYDANSGLFINILLKTFLRWDPLLNTYLRVDMPGLGQPVGVGVPHDSGPLNSNTSTGLSTVASFLPAGTVSQADLLLGANQLSNPAVSSTTVPGSEDSFMNEIWQRMRALAKEAVDDTQSTSEIPKVRSDSSSSDDSGDHGRSKRDRSSTSRSRSSSRKDKNRKSRKRRTSISRSRSSSKGERKIKKRPRRSRSLDDRRSRSREWNRALSRSPGRRRRGSCGRNSRSHSKGRRSSSRRHRRSISRSLSRNRRARRSRSRELRSRSRGKESSSRRPIRSTSRSPSRSIRARRSHRRESRSHSKGKGSSSRRPRRSKSRSLSRSRRARRSRSKGRRSPGCKVRRFHSRGARRSRSRSFRRSRSAGRRSRSRETRISISLSPSPEHRRKARNVAPQHSGVERKIRNQRESESPKRKHRNKHPDYPSTPKNKKRSRKKREPTNEIPLENEENQAESDGLSEFDFLKETLDDDNESVIIDEYEETLEHDESVFESKDLTTDMGDILGHLFTNDWNKFRNIILVAPVPLQDDGKNTKSLKSQVGNREDVEKVLVYHKNAVGSPCHYLLTYFRTTEAAAQWFESNDGVIILSDDDGTHMKGYLHFAETGNWFCENCKCTNFILRTLCHKCYQAKDNGYSPVSLSKEPTKWVAISKLKSCFPTIQSVLDSLPSLDDFKIQTIRMITDLRHLSLGLCVFEVECEDEGTRLHGFLQRQGRASVYVTLRKPCGGESTDKTNSLADFLQESLNAKQLNDEVIPCEPPNDSSGEPQTESGTIEKPVCSVTGDAKNGDPVAVLFSEETPRNILLVAPIPLYKKTKSELSSIESALENSLKSTGVEYTNVTLFIDKNVGAPCSYGLIHFSDLTTAADFRSKHNNLLTIMIDAFAATTSGKTSFKVFLHFSQDNWVCRNCQNPNFPFRSLCHQCFTHREENVSSPVKKSTSTTRWVATSKLNEWTDDDSIVADFKNGMKDLKITKSDVLRDPKFRAFPLACVFETASWGESLRLREFLLRTGRFSHFVTLNQCFREYTCTYSAPGDEVTQTNSADSRSRPSIVSQEYNISPQGLVERAAVAGTDSASGDNIVRSTSSGSEESAPAIVSQGTTDKTSSDRTETAAKSFPVVAGAVTAHPHLRETNLDSEAATKPSPVGTDSAHAVAGVPDSSALCAPVGTDSAAAVATHTDPNETNLDYEAATQLSPVSTDSAAAVAAHPDPNETNLDCEAAQPLPVGTESSDLYNVDAGEPIPEACCKKHLIWWNPDSPTFPSVLNGLFVNNPATRVPAGDTIFIGPLSSYNKICDATASALQSILSDKLEQDHLEFLDICIHSGLHTGAPCVYALVKFKTFQEAEVCHSLYQNGLILPIPQHSRKSALTPTVLTSRIGPYFKTFVYHCQPNWWCAKCSRMNFGLRSNCFLCYTSKVKNSPIIITFPKTPTTCVCIRRFKAWCSTREILCESDSFFKSQKFSMKFVKDECGLPLGICVLETADVGTARILYERIRDTTLRKGLEYGILHQEIPNRAVNPILHQEIPNRAINPILQQRVPVKAKSHNRRSIGNFVEVDIKEMFINDSPTDILFLGPISDDLRGADSFYKALLPEDRADCVEVEFYSSEDVGAPLNYYLIHFNSVDSATDFYEKRRGRMILDHKSLPDGTFEKIDPVTAFLHFSEDNWTCDCGSKNFPCRSICSTCYKGRFVESAPFIIQDTPTKLVGVRARNVWCGKKKLLGMSSKKIASFKVMSVTMLSDPRIPRDTFPFFIVETLSIKLAQQMRNFYKTSCHVCSTYFVALKEPAYGAYVGKEVTYRRFVSVGPEASSNQGSTTKASLPPTEHEEILVSPDYETIVWTSLYESRLNKPPSNVIMISSCPGDRKLPDGARAQIQNSLLGSGVNHESIFYNSKGAVGSPFSYCLISFDSVDSAKKWMDTCSGTFKFDVPCPEDETSPLNFLNCFSQKPASEKRARSYYISSKLHYSSPNWQCSCGTSNFSLRSLCHNCFKNKNLESDYETVSEPTCFVGIKLREYHWMNDPKHDLDRLGHSTLKSSICLDPALPRDPRGLVILELPDVECAFKLFDFLVVKNKNSGDETYRRLLTLLEKSCGITYLKCPKSEELRWSIGESENWDSFFTNVTPTNILAVDMSIHEKPVFDIPLEQYGGYIRRCRKLGGFIPFFWLIYFPNSQAAKEWYDANNGKLKSRITSKVHSLHFSPDLWVCADCFSVNFFARVLCHRCYKHRMNGFSPLSLVSKDTRFVGVLGESEQRQAITSMLERKGKKGGSFSLRGVQLFGDPNIRHDGTYVLVFEVFTSSEGDRLRNFFRNRGVTSSFFECFVPSEKEIEQSSSVPQQSLAGSSEGKDPKSMPYDETQVDFASDSCFDTEPENNKSITETKSSQVPNSQENPIDCNKKGSCSDAESQIHESVPESAALQVQTSSQAEGYPASMDTLESNALEKKNYLLRKCHDLLATHCKTPLAQKDPSSVPNRPTPDANVECEPSATTDAFEESIADDNVDTPESEGARKNQAAAITEADSFSTPNTSFQMPGDQEMPRTE